MAIEAPLIIQLHTLLFIGVWRFFWRGKEIMITKQVFVETMPLHEIETEIMLHI